MLYKGGLDTGAKAKAIGAVTAFASILLVLPDIFFHLMIDTLGEEDCLILRAADFKDTRISDEFIRWSDVGKIEKWNSSGYFRGVLVYLKKLCQYKSSYFKVFGAHKVFSRYTNPKEIYIHLRPLQYDRNELREIFFTAVKRN